MEYYILSNATEEKIIGKKYPQCKGMPSGLGLTSKWFEQPNSMTKLTNDEFPNFEPELIFELEEKAILTDVVSPSNISAKGMLVNEKVKNILSNFTLMEHKYYPATLIHKEQKLNYYWLHFVKKDLIGLDLDKSIFYKSMFGIDKGGYVKFSSYQNGLQILRHEDCFIMPEKLVFNAAYEQSLNQVFYLPIPNRIIIREDVVDSFKTNKIKGVTLNLIK
jgi:hypothetical protein